MRFRPSRKHSAHAQASPPQEAGFPEHVCDDRSGARRSLFRRILEFVLHSVSRAALSTKHWLRIAAYPQRWRLWDWGPGAVAWVLCTEPLIAAWAMAEAFTARYDPSDFIRFALLTSCALTHVISTRESEERRREAHGNATHVDQTSIWIFSAALVLPVPLVLVLVAVVRIQRFLIARKPFYKFMFTSASIAASAMGVHAVAAATPLREWLTGQRELPSEAVGMLESAGALITAVAVYFLVQAVLIGVVRGLGQHSFSVNNTLGDLESNMLILHTLLIAGCVSLVQALSVPLLLLMVPVAVYNTRREQRLIQIKAAHEKLRVDAWHDELTGLLNRHGFLPEATLALVSDQAQDQPTSLLILDLDHFKSFNDRLGHIGGDQVLVAFAKAVRSVIRHGDLVCRWGGEEVAVVLPRTSRDDAAVLAERIRVAVAEMQVEVTKPAGGQAIRLNCDGEPGCTVSIGVAVSPMHGTELVDLSELADQALYQAKDSGRNRVVLASVCAPVSTVCAPQVQPTGIH